MFAAFLNIIRNLLFGKKKTDEDTGKMTKIKESGKISTPLEVTSQYVTEPTRKVSHIKKVTPQKNTEKNK